jgi:hypothetical protein
MIQGATNTTAKGFHSVLQSEKLWNRKIEHVGEYRNDGNIHVIQIFVLQKLILENTCVFQITHVLSIIVMGWHEGNLHNILKGKHCKGSLLRRP